MKSVLISIQPKWCELIASGKKTVEVRKTKPKLETPFKVYIYCTKPRHYYKISKHLLVSDESLFLVNGKMRMCDGFGVEYEDRDYKHLNCKVIGEFVCDRLIFLDAYYDTNGNRHLCNTAFVRNTYLTDDELFDYLYGKLGRKHGGWAWHISDLVIYDKPKELREFYRECEKTECDDCPYLHFENTPNSYEGWCEFDEKIPIKRPPQSWCYVWEGEQ